MNPSKKHSVFLAVLIGIMASTSLYYVWCSLQWKDNAAQTSATGATTPNPTPTPTPGQALNPGASFVADGAVAIDVRTGQRFIEEGGDRITQVLLKAQASNATGVQTKVPTNVSLVIDRSGSMRGDRIHNARAAADFVVSQLSDGDTVSVVSYANDARVEMPATILSAHNRWQVQQAIQRIEAGGGTCISCGLDTGRNQLLQGRNDLGVNRVLLFSDGDANAGVADAAGLSSIAQGIENVGATVTTLGVGLDYNETIMGQIAVNGNGNHYFVENPQTLASTLANELQDLQELVARRAVASFELADGVRFLHGFDRSFQVVGNRVTVSLGDMGVGEDASVLFEVSVPADDQGIQPVADVRFDYDDLRINRAVAHQGVLEVGVTNDGALAEASVDLDVTVRAEQARMNRAIADATTRLKAGDSDGANSLLLEARGRASGFNTAFGTNKFDNQLEALDEIAGEFEAAAAAAPEDVERAAKKTMVKQRDLAR